MTILQALKKHDFVEVKLSNGDKWLIYDGNFDHWKVYQRKANAKKTILLTMTESEKEAVNSLLND